MKYGRVFVAGSTRFYGKHAGAVLRHDRIRMSGMKITGNAQNITVYAPLSGESVKTQVVGSCFIGCVQFVCFKF